jgi:FkbM family methyltransferase
MIIAKQNSRWAARSLLVSMRLGGQRFRLRLAGRTDLLVLEDILLRGEYSDAPACPDGTIIDLGAHIGLATLRLLAANPTARVIAVEADPALIPQLRANTLGLPVVVVNAAVGDRSTPRTLWHSTKLAWGNSFRRVALSQTPVTVRGLTFEDLLQEVGVTEIDLLKLDIEGAEWEAFPAGLPSNVHAVTGELHGYEGDPVAAAAAFARDMEIHVRFSDPERLMFTGKRLIARST